MKQTVITNLRLPSDEWTQLKSLASEIGVSANTLIRNAIKEYTIHRMLQIEEGAQQATANLWDEWTAFSTKPKQKPPQKLSKEDASIYE